MNKWVPIVILLLAGMSTWFIVKTKPGVEKVVVERKVPIVEVIVASATRHTLTLRASGVVEAPTTTELAAEVVGRVIEISPDFESGGFFEEGGLLLRIDPSDYEAELANAKADLAEAEYNHALEKAEAGQARKEWALLGEGEPTAMALRRPQIAMVDAVVESARANVERAARNLERTYVKAPYRGRVWKRTVDIGQYIGAPGTTLGVVYSIDFAEVRLPITDRQASLMDFSIQYSGRNDTILSAPILLEVIFGSECYRWEGFVDRVEGVVDDETRLFHVVGRIAEPYRRRVEGQPPLQIGMYASAAIRGKILENAFVLPRLAMVEENKVLIVGTGNRLESRLVKVAQSEGDQVIVVSGLYEGERVIVTPLDYIVEGMRVDPLEADIRNQ